MSSAPLKVGPDWKLTNKQLSELAYHCGGCGRFLAKLKGQRLSAEIPCRCGFRNIVSVNET